MRHVDVKLAPMSTPLKSNCIGESKFNDVLGIAIMNSSSSMGAAVQDQAFRSNLEPSLPHSVG